MEKLQKAYGVGLMGKRITKQHNKLSQRCYRKEHKRCKNQGSKCQCTCHYSRGKKD